ncbi:MAG: hypothetical protein Kow0092_15670 [Deferrisomatales bacterium]
MGIVVRDLEAAGRALERLLRVRPEAVRVEAVGLRALLFPLGEAAVELLQFQGPVEGIDPAVFEPAPGIQHLAFRVEALDAALARLERAGIRPLEGFPRPGLRGPIAFFRDPGTGALVELVERNRCPPAPPGRRQ